MNLYILGGLILTVLFILWRVYRAGAKNKQLKIERDSLEHNLGVEHGIRDSLLEARKNQKAEVDLISSDFESARNLWLQHNSDPPKNGDSGKT